MRKVINTTKSESSAKCVMCQPLNTIPERGTQLLQWIIIR